MLLIEIERRIGLPSASIQDVFMYGSHVYGTNTHKSDYDFVIITNDRIGQYSDNLVDITFYNKEQFQQRIDDHEISALECIFLSEDKILKRTNRYVFKLNKSKLRHSLSAKSSNSFVKAKKKLTVPQDYDAYIGKKSLYHSFRIIMFGIQIAKYGTITDYGVANQLLLDVMKIDDWDTLFINYKQRYNNLMSDFRLVAPLT